MIKRTKAVRICRYAVLYLVLVVFGLFFLFPFVFMFFKSVMSDLESVGMPYVRFFPTEWHLRITQKFSTPILSGISAIRSSLSYAI